MNIEEGDWVYLKVSLEGSKEVRAKKIAKPKVHCTLSSIRKANSNMAYRMALPEEYEGIHNIFHVFSLRKSFRNQQFRKIDPKVPLQLNLTYDERLVQMDDRTLEGVGSMV